MEQLTSHQKVAEAILVLSPRQAAEMLRTFNETQILFAGESLLKHARFSKVQREKQEVKAPHDTQSGEVSENTENTENTDTFLKMTARDFSEMEVVKALYRLAFGEKKSQEFIKKLLRLHIKHRFSFLNNYTAEQLFRALHNESSIVMSLVVSVLDSDKVALMLPFFDPTKRYDIIRRVIAQKSPSVQVFEAMESVLRLRLNTIAQEDERKEHVDGELNLLHILGYLSLEEQDRLLETVEDEVMRDRIQTRLYSWSLLDEISTSNFELVIAQFEDQDFARLIMRDGDVAQKNLETILSKNRMEHIEYEISIMTRDFHTQIKELQHASVVRKRFFYEVKKYVGQEVLVK